MTISVRVGGTVRPISTIKLCVQGIVRTVRTVKVMEGGQLRVVYSSAQSLTVGITPTVMSASSRRLPVVSNYATANPTGGTGPYSYFWTIVSVDGGFNTTIESPTFASTRFSMNVLEDEPGIGRFRCTVTDSLGNTASDTVDCTFRFFSVGGTD